MTEMNRKQYSLLIVLILMASLLISCAGMTHKRYLESRNIHEYPSIGIEINGVFALEVSQFTRCHSIERSPSENPIKQSPAEKAGIRIGDRIKSIASVPVTNSVELRKAIRVKEPGNSIEITVDRNGARLRFLVDVCFINYHEVGYQWSIMDEATDNIVWVNSEPFRLAVVMGKVSDLTSRNEFELRQWEKFVENQLISWVEKRYLTRYRNSENFAIVDRNKLDKILNEHKLSMIGLMSAESRTKLGQLLGVTHLLVIDTSRTLQRKDIILDLTTARLIEIRTGEVIHTTLTRTEIRVTH